MKKFASIILFVVVATVSAQSSAREISYYAKDMHSVAHLMVGDHGHNALYVIPMNNVQEHLEQRYDLKRTSLWVLNKRVLPGKSLIRLTRGAIYHGKSAALSIEPRELFGELVADEKIPHTYAITDDRLVFVESTENPHHEHAKDKFSKHYVISGMKTKVRFAGEFHVYKQDNGDVHVVFDNASGTYQPGDDGLANLKKLLDSNFADQGIYFHVKSWNQKVVVDKMYRGEQDMLVKKDKH